MNNTYGTGTVNAFKLSEDETTVTANIICHSSYPNKDGEIVHKNVVVRGEYKFRSADEKNALTIAKGSRVAFKGYMEGAYNEKGSANGPHIGKTAKGEPICYYEATLTGLYITGAKAKSHEDFEDMLETTLWGFLGRDAEMRYTQDSKTVISTSIAFNLVKYAEEVRQKLTVWWNSVYFGQNEKAIDSIMKYWKKGKALILQGTPLANQSYGGPNIWGDNKDRASYELNVTSWTFAPGKRDENGAPTSYSSSDLVAGNDEEIPF